MLVQFGDKVINPLYVHAISEPKYGNDFWVDVFLSSGAVSCKFLPIENEEVVRRKNGDCNYGISFLDNNAIDIEWNCAIGRNVYLKFNKSFIYKRMVDSIKQVMEMKPKTWPEESKEKLSEKYVLGLAKLKNEFTKDKFEIYICIVCRDFNKSSTDHLLSLVDLVKLIHKTNEVFDSFDNSISIEENVNNFYRNDKNNS